MFAEDIPPLYNPTEINIWAQPDLELPSIFTTANVSDTSRAGYVQTGISTGSVAPTSSVDPSSTTPGVFERLKNWFLSTPLPGQGLNAAVQQDKAKASGFFSSVGDWVSGSLTKIIIILVLLFVGFLFVKKQMGV